MKKNNMYIYKKSGFTLIELLVVIAIIGILASVVLASLSSARNKNIDASVKSNLNQARTQAELYFITNNGSYLDVCNSTKDTTDPKGINLMVLRAAEATGLSGVTFNGTGTMATATCNSTATAWAAEAPLKNTANSVYCVDYTRKGVVKTTSIGNATAC